MNKLKYIFFSLLLLLTTYISINAETCDKEDIKRLKIIADNVSVNYAIDNDAINNGDYDTFNVEISGLTDELYFYFGEDIENYYDYSNTHDGNIILDNFYSGDFKVYFASYNCGNILKTVNLNIPKYNIISLDDRCKEDKYKDLDICDEWYQWNVNVNSDDFNADEYFDDGTINSDDVIELLKKYYYILLVLFLIIIILIMIFIRRHRKRWSLE